jgi:hypothetical protein
MEDLFKHVFKQSVPDSENKSKKVLKSEKVEDPTSCENYDDLRKCTTGILNQFCKDHGLKIGGNKKEIMDRVWRHIQGQSSDEDKSSRNKPKTPKKVPEKHSCCGTNTSGAPCGISATEEFEGKYFCYKHIAHASKFNEKTNETGKVAKVVQEIENKKPKPRAKLAPKQKEELQTEESENE